MQSPVQELDEDVQILSQKISPPRAMDHNMVTLTDEFYNVLEDSDYLSSWDFSTSDNEGTSEVRFSSPQNETSSSTETAISQPSTPKPTPSTKIPPPPFKTPPKLRKVEEVMNDHGGTDVASLRNLTTALAREAIFGKEELAKNSLSGRKNTGILNKEKLSYIKTLVKSRVPGMTQVEFEHIWTLCRGSLSKSCQTIRASFRRN